MADALTFDPRPELGRARLVDLATEIDDQRNSRPDLGLAVCQRVFSLAARPLKVSTCIFWRAVEANTRILCFSNGYASFERKYGSRSRRKAHFNVLPQPLSFQSFSVCGKCTTPSLTVES
jgi:hypothetical protein